MKKKLLFGLVCLLIIAFFVTAEERKLLIRNLNFTVSKDNAYQTSLFDPKFAITNLSPGINHELVTELTELSDRITYLLLGDPGINNNDYILYAKRREALFALRYAPKIPLNESGEVDRLSPEYNDDTITGVNIPGMLKTITEKNIIYYDKGQVKIFATKDYIVARTVLKDILIEKSNPEKPKELLTVKTNLILTYFYKLSDQEYKLYWIMAETKDSLTTFMKTVSANETIGKAINTKYYAEAKIYDYTQLNSLTDGETTAIYNRYQQDIVSLDTYYDKSIIGSATGFFIAPGYIVTSWRYLESALTNGQNIIISNHDNKIFNMIGVVTYSAELDVVVIKLAEKIGQVVEIGDSSILKVNNPIITINSKTNQGLSMTSGIIIEAGEQISSLLPLANSDQGSPLYNRQGQLIGMAVSEALDSSISVGLNSKYLKSIQDMLINSETEIPSVSYQELKDNYYQKINQEKIINNIPSKIWREYNQLGNLSDSIILPLTKANYQAGIVSLRYQNEIAHYVSSMMMAETFKAELIKTGFVVKLNSAKKCVYESKEYRIVILDELNSLIILMVRI